MSNDHFDVVYNSCEDCMRYVAADLCDLGHEEIITVGYCEDWVSTDNNEQN